LEFTIKTFLSELAVIFGDCNSHTGCGVVSMTGFNIDFFFSQLNDRQIISDKPSNNVQREYKQLVIFISSPSIL
jgi:hypothetical protein